MKAHLFYTFLIIFAATSVITLLGVTNVVVIREGYLTALVSAFLLELAGAVIAIFKSANFFSLEKSQISTEERIWSSIRKMDTAFGYLDDRLKAQTIHIQSRLLASQNLAPTPRTDIMALVAEIGPLVGKIHPDVIDEALGTIANVLETNVRVGSSEQASLVSLCKSLPTRFAGSSSRVLNALETRKT